jgi:uncharacterized protein with PIN domain
MLGKLARWLRILGHDVTYSNPISDNELLRLAEKENRVLLTRDLQLYKRAIGRGLDAYYVEGKSESTRIAKVTDRYNLLLTINMDKSRCPICNTPIETILKEKIKDQVKEKTYANYNQFWKCPNCGQIYWQGAHWKQIQNTLIRAQEEKSQKNLILLR